MLHDNLKRLTTDQLGQCRLDAYAMERRPGNGVAEYRQAIRIEEIRRSKKITCPHGVSSPDRCSRCGINMSLFT